VENQLNGLSTKERIIRVTMDMIAEEGLQNITIRKIAARAGVNVAAVNYHFGSKDVLINEALRNVIDQLKSAFEYLKTEGQDEKAKLYTFVSSFIGIVVEYPDILKNMVRHAINDHPLNVQEEYLAFIRHEGFALIKETIGKITPGLDDQVLSLKALNLVSGLNFPILMGEHLKELLGIDLYNEEMRKAYITILVDNICRKD